MTGEGLKLIGIEFFKTIDSQIEHIIDDTLALQYDKQIKVINHLITYLAKNPIPKLEDMPIIDESIVELNYTKKLFETNIIANKYEVIPNAEDLKKIYEESAKLIYTDILTNINAKAEELQTPDREKTATWGEFEKQYAIQYRDSTSILEQQEIIKNYRKAIDDQLQTSIREQQKIIQDTKDTQSNTHNVTNPYFVNEGILSEIEVSYLVHNYELLSALTLYFRSPDKYKILALFDYVRGIDPNDITQGFRQLGEVNYDKVYFIIQSNIFKLLKHQGISLREVNLLRIVDLEKIALLEHITIYNTLLELVITNKIEPTLLHLLEINVNAQDKHGNTLLHYAVLSNNGLITKVINAGADVNAKALNLKTPLHLAVEKNHIKIVKKLIKHKADVHAKTIRDETALHLSAKHGYTSIAKKLIKHGADVNAKTIDHETPLYFAAFYGNTEIVANLLKHNADVSVKAFGYMTSLHAAVENKHLKITKLLLKHDADVNAVTPNNIAPLHLIAENGDLKLAEELINHGADVNIKNIIHKTPLHMAIENRHLKIIELLLKHNADVEAKTSEHETPLHFAAKKGYPGVVKTLIKNKADVNVKTIHNETPLHFAAKRGYQEIVKTLIKHDADVNATTFNNETPLHFAAENGYTSIVQILIKHDADINIKTIKHKTSLDLALSNGYTDIANILATDIEIVRNRDVQSLQNFAEIIDNTGVVLDQGRNNNCNNRFKKSSTSCVSDKTFSYDPLVAQDLYTLDKTQVQLHNNIILSKVWDRDRDDQKSDKIRDIMTMNSHILDILKKPRSSWNRSDAEIYKQYRNLSQQVQNINLETPLLEEITEDIMNEHSCLIYDNGRVSVLVLKYQDHYKLYSADLNYKKLLRTTKKLSEQELQSFIKSFFAWYDDSSIYKRYTVSKNVDKIKELILPNIEPLEKLVMDNLNSSFNSKVNHLKHKEIVGLFAIDNKIIPLKEVHPNFFKINKSRLTVRIDNLHKILPKLTEQEKFSFFRIIKKYKLSGSWENSSQELNVADQKLIHRYTTEVIDIINTQGNIDLTKLSELSKQLLEEEIRFTDNIPKAIAEHIVNTAQKVTEKFSGNELVKTHGADALFFLPTLIKSVNSNNYKPLVGLGEMIAGDMAAHQGLSAVMQHLGRPALTKVLSSPIMKIYTIYSIFELHKELHKMSNDDPRKEVLEMSLASQYATAGLLAMDMLGLETGPLWIGLLVVQFIFETYEFKKIYNLDVSVIDAFLMNLGFEKDRLSKMLDERSLVQEYLLHSNHPGWQIIQLPKIVGDISKIIEEKYVDEKILNSVNNKITTSKVFPFIVEEDAYTVKVECSSMAIDTVLASLYYKIAMCPNGGIKTKEWSIKTLYISPENAEIIFDQYINQDISRLESNNWFLGSFKQNNQQWCRVPQLSNENNECPIPKYKSSLLQNTSSSAMYMNKDFTMNDPNQLNSIFLHYRPEFGNIDIHFKRAGIEMMDYINKFYLMEMNNNATYDSSIPWTLNVLVLDHQDKIFSLTDKINKKFRVLSDHNRVITNYIIDRDTVSNISDNTTHTQIKFSSYKNPDNTNYHYVQGSLNRIIITPGGSEDIIRDIHLNLNKLYLSIFFNNHLIHNQALIANHLEVFNVRGVDAGTSTLDIPSQVKSFKITVLGNITIVHQLSTFTIKEISLSEDTIEITKIKNVAGDIIYEVIVDDIDNVFKSLKREEHNSEINIEFLTGNKKCLLKNILSKNSIITFKDAFDKHNKTLIMDKNESMLKMKDDYGVTTYTVVHYNNDPINIGGHLLEVFVYKSEKIIGKSSNVNNADLYYLIKDDEILFKFIELNNTISLHVFSNNQNYITFNGIQYMLENNQIWATGSINNIIDVRKLLYLNSEDGLKQVGVRFTSNIGESVFVQYNQTSVMIDNITLNEISPYTRLKFNYFEINFDIVNKSMTDKEIVHEQIEMSGENFATPVYE